MKKSLLMLIFTISEVFGALLVGCACPSSMYAYEVGECNVYVYNSGDLPISAPYSLQSLGKLVFLDGDSGEIEVPPGGIITISTKIWANGAGKEEFRFMVEKDIGAEGCFKKIYLKEPPVTLNIPVKNIPAGKRVPISAEVRGRAYDVKIMITYPPGIRGDESIDVGDVDGSKQFSFSLVADPLLTGAQEIQFIIKFVDETGGHTLKVSRIFNVAPPWDLLAVIAAVVVVVILVIILKRRRKKSEE